MSQQVAGHDHTLTYSADVATVLDHIDRNIVIVYTFSGRVDALELETAIEDIVRFASTLAAAAQGDGGNKRRRMFSLVHTNWTPSC